MRIWHKDLIKVLPKQELMSQWRDCCNIAKFSIINDDGSSSIDHPLVRKLQDYKADHFYSYAKLVHKEMKNRGLDCSWSKFEKYWGNMWNLIDVDEIFYGWHGDRYLNQCFYILQERFDCGLISEEEFTEIDRLVTLLSL